MALWGGRFIIKSHSFFKSFNNSINVDYQLVEQDITGSIAWSEALFNSNVLTQVENNKIKNCLFRLLKKVKSNPKIVLESASEDVHSWVENQLINDLGNLGKKLHTGRSRNDQIATDLKLWCKISINNLLKCISDFKKQLIILAEKTQEVIMPGYTHLQRAQPITFAFWCLAYVEMLKRDESRLIDTYNRLDVSPLGCGALSGTTWNIDREKLAKSLGFSSATNNSLDSVSDRDYIVELASAASIGMMHLSRFAEDLIFFNSSESNFIELSDAITSGSSLMPQKKNPDSLELIRAKSGKVFGFLINILVILKALPLSYNKDIQEDKEGLFSICKVWSDSLIMSAIVLDNLYVNSSNCLKAAENSYSNSTELAEYLVKKGIAFRDAHQIAGKIVLLALQLKIPLEKIDLATFKKFSSVIDDDVYKVLNISELLKKRNSKGGVAPKLVLQVINAEKNF